MSPPQPSSGSTGFFQDAPVLLNQFEDDRSFQAAFNLFLPDPIKSEIASEFKEFGDYVLSPEIQRLLASADAHLPFVQSHDSFGRRVDRLITSEGWRGLQTIGIREGVVAAGFEARHGRSRRVYHFLKYLLWSPSSAITTCPAAMTDGAAALIKLQLRTVDNKNVPIETRRVLERAFSRLTSRDPSYAWTSGQWMTERSGGSDVRGTETRASLAPDVLPGAFLSATASDKSPLGAWRIDGFKWFSSATDADMSVFLAKTGDSDNLSLFFAPTRLRVKKTDTCSGDQAENDVFNGIQIQRLKSKIGTRALPTAELILSDMRAYMLGQPGKGTREISPVLNITRIHNSVSAVAGWGRALAISRSYSRVRRVSGGKLLVDVPAHVRGLAEQHVFYRANMLFTFFVVNLLGIVENVALHGNKESNPTPSTTSPSVANAEQLLRLMTPVLKATTALNGIDGVRFCMESLGGIGYLEDPSDPLLNVAKILRDGLVLSIWEGTTDVMGADTIRVIAGSGASNGPMLAFQQWIEQACASWGAHAELRHADQMAAKVHAAFSKLSTTIRQAKSVDELLYRAREMMFDIAWIVSAVLLVEEAAHSKSVTSWEIAKRCFEMEDHVDWQQRAAVDRQIVFEDLPSVHSRL